MNEVEETRLREDYLESIGASPTARPWSVIRELIERELIKPVAWLDEHGKWFGSFALELGPDYIGERVRLEICWLRHRTGLRQHHIDEVCALLHGAAKALGLYEVTVRGRPGWDKFAKAVKAKEIERVWRIKVEDLET